MNTSEKIIQISGKLTGLLEKGLRQGRFLEIFQSNSFLVQPKITLQTKQG